MNSRSRLSRIQKIDRWFQAGKCLNKRQLAEKLECSTKTVQRDLEYLKDTVGRPLEWDAGENGFSYTSNDFCTLPELEVTEGEALALFVAEQALRQYRGTPYEEPLRTAFSKLAGQMQDIISFSPLDLDRYVSFGHRGRAITDIATYDQVMRGLLEEREVIFKYRKGGARRSETRTVKPYHLLCYENQWYLIGWDRKRRALRTFVLGRIRAFEGYGEPFERPADFNLPELLSGGFGIFQGNGNFEVVIEFDPEVAHLVRERQWSGHAEVGDLDDGGARVTCSAHALEEVEAWVLSFGSRARVIRPPALRNRVKQAAKEMTGLYDLPPWFQEFREESGAPDPQVLIDFIHELRRSPEHPGQLDLELSS